MSGEPIQIVFRGGVYLAYNESMTGWNSIDPDTESVCLSADFVIVGVCEASSGISVFQRAATVDDGALVVLDLCSSEDVDRSAKLSGVMEQSGSVFVGNVGVSSALAPWQFDVDVVPGDYDLVASNDFELTGGRVAIRRALKIRDNHQESRIDLVSEGVVTDVRSIAPINLELDESLSTRTTFETETTSALVASSDGPEIHLVPAGLLEDSDRLAVELTTIAQRGAFRSIRIITGAVELEPLFAPRLDGKLTYAEDGDGNATVSWDAIEPSMFSSASFRVFGDTGSLDLTATRAWLERTNTRRIALDSTTPGFETTWVVSTPSRTTFAIEDELDGNARRSIEERDLSE